MFQKLVSHNDDIRLLVETGYAVAFDSNYLVIRDIPYLDQSGALQWGAIVTKLVFIDSNRVQQENHQIFFAGSSPCNLNGTPIPNLGDSPTTLALSPASSDVAVQRAFSNKPPGGFPNFFAKIQSYVAIICGPAMDRYDVDPFSYRTVESAPDSVFKFNDTLTSRAEITDLSALFANEIVAVIGLGGTGSYVLDFLVRTPVKEIRGFDIDPYHVHNAFRSPGRVQEDEFDKSKAEVYQARYENFRHGFQTKATYIGSYSGEDLEAVTFAFVCVDKGSSRSGIIDILLELKIPFIDVGMGLNRKHGPLNGMLRTTYFPADQGAQVRSKNWVEVSDDPNDLYRTNIQIGELNALNAALAVIRYKQLKGFYHEDRPFFSLLFEVADLSMIGESDLDAV